MMNTNVESKFPGANNTSRSVEAELLDALSPEDPRAVQSRRDLRRVNFWMGHSRIFARALRTGLAVPPRHIVEIGCGDGTLMLQIAKRLPLWENVKLTLVDKEQLVSQKTVENFRELGWLAENVKSDVFAWLERRQTSDCVLANLFLHHFEPASLGRLLDLVGEQTGLFIACEPRRSNRTRMQRALLKLIGCNAVTLHDAEISIRAGFCSRELSALWPEEGWRMEERKAGLFSHLFVAKRRKP